MSPQRTLATRDGAVRRGKTGIEWTEQTWNPFVGCSKKSEGCKHCYAIRQAARIESFGNVPHYDGVTKSIASGTDWSGKVALASESVLSKVRRFKPGELVFVNSMSDFWHESAKDEWRVHVLDLMAGRPDVAFQVLTKRPENIAPMLARMKRAVPECMWLGSTVESRKQIGRIDILREVPAVLRFLSIEPLLDDVAGGLLDLRGIHWVIIGGESGEDARPMRYEWVVNVLLACAAQRVPVFFKQWGSWRNNPLAAQLRSLEAVTKADPTGKGGSLVDGKSYKEMPERFWSQWGRLRGTLPERAKGQRFLPLM